MANDPKNIILHHSLTKDSETVSWSAIRFYHMHDLGWIDIGYHFGIELIGSKYEIITGRLLTQEGAHCSQDGMNRKSVGICFVGNFDIAEPPKPQWDLGLRLVSSLMDILDIPREKVYGHRNFAHYKTCPGKLFDLDKFRGEL